MRRPFVPAVVAVGAGLIVLLHEFVSNPLLDGVGGTLVAWSALVSAFAILLGLINVLAVHLARLARQARGAWSSAVILATAAVVLLVVLPSGGASDSSAWVMRYFYQPLEAAFLALLVFFIASAAFRTLRVRSWETALFVGAALVVLVGAAPVASLVSPWLPAAKEWLLAVPTVAGVRGILLGVALGVTVTGLRLLAAVDRPYAE